MRPNRGKRRVHAVLLIFLLLAAFPVLVVADDYVGGVPLTTVQTGTVTGDLYMNITPAPNWGLNDVTKTFTLPAAAVAAPGRIKWARLYISAYCGHMQNDYAFHMTNRFDGNGDGIYEQVWPETVHAPFHYLTDPTTGDPLGNDNTALGGGLHDPYKMLNDHETRVTSDYLAYYDITNLITSRTVNVNVNTAGSFDGRIKVISLVAAYDDPASTTLTTYWVNQGHDVCSYYPEDNLGEAAVGTTTFATSALSGITSAKLIIDYMASNNGIYGFPTAVNDFNPLGNYQVDGSFLNHPLDRIPDVQGPYSGVDSWDVTSDVTSAAALGRDVTFAYARDFGQTGLSAFYKIPLAFLVVKSPKATPAPMAGFSATPLSGAEPLTVSFTDTSTNTPTSWKWEYRNASSGWSQFAATRNPFFRFAAGTYDIRLTATNAGGSSTKVRMDYLAVSAPGSPGNAVAISGVILPHTAPVANFSASPTDGSAPLTVRFTDLSTGGPASWAWDFDNDGVVDSTEQNPSYTYTTAGTYTVNFTAANALGSDGQVRTDYITVAASSEGSGAAVTGLSQVPVAAFTAAPTSGIAPLIVQFTDQSSGSPWYWRWDFGDGENSASKNPSHTYSAAGRYTTTLEVSGDNLQWSSPASQDITVNTGSGLPGVSFTGSPTSGPAPLSVRFNDSSSGFPTSWAWDFDNDGVVDSTEQNPVHTYGAAGTYGVRLTASNTVGSASLTRSGYIIVTTGSTPPDLSVDSIVPNLGSVSGGNVFALEPNAVTLRISNLGAGSSDATTVKLASSDGFSGTAPVPALAGGSNTTVVITDTTVRSTAGGSVTYTATVDPDNMIPESSKSNNVKTGNAITVRYNGYKGKRYWPGAGGDIVTRHTFDLNGSLLYSRGDSVYRSGSFGDSGWLSYTVNWNPDDLAIPANATVKAAYLYVPYTWDNENIAPDHTFIDFNGNRMSRSSGSSDESNFGVYANYAYGLLTYDVTPTFRKNQTNSAIFTRENPKYTDPAQAAVYTKISMYEFFLVVVYEDPSVSRHQIFINEGFDLLGASPEYGTTETEAIAYVPFTGMAIDTSAMKHATLVTFVPSGDSHEGNLLYNGNVIAADVWDYGGTGTGENGIPEVAIDARDVGPYIKPTGNTFGIQSTDLGGTPCMCASQQFLVIDYGGGTSPDAALQPLSVAGPAPVAVNTTLVSATGNVTSGPVTGDFAAMKGVTVRWSANITGLAGTGGNITTSLLQSPDSETIAGYSLALADRDLAMQWLAYSAVVNKTGITSVGQAIIEMSVPGPLVDQYGGPDSMRILRRGDDGRTEVLNTMFSGYDSAGHMIFQGISPNGLSCFSLVAVTSLAEAQTRTGPSASSNVTSGAPYIVSATGGQAPSKSLAGSRPGNLTGAAAGRGQAGSALPPWFTISVVIGGFAILGAMGVIRYRNRTCPAGREVPGGAARCADGTVPGPDPFVDIPPGQESLPLIARASDRLHFPRSRYSRILVVIAVIAVAAIVILAVGPFRGLPQTGSKPASSNTPGSSFTIVPTIERIEDLDLTNHAPDYPAGFSARNGLLFISAGTEKHAVSDLELRLSEGGNEVVLTQATRPPAGNDLGPGRESYFDEMGKGDGILDPGEWLMVYADNCYDSSLAKSPPVARVITWQPAGSVQKIEVQAGDTLGYTLKDTRTGSVLQQGTIRFVPP